ncbi:hypothetical protein MY1884_000682 [Beauveria asiatica]
MAQAGVLAFNIGAFVSTLFLLEFGADKFIAHTSTLARRINISEVIVGLLTAGAEWEELAVVVGALAQGRSSLALGNVVGASISNILGAFSLGLLMHSGEEVVEFDRSARIYSLLLLVLTTVVAPVIYYSTNITWFAGGIVLIAAFVVYLLLVAVAIGRGLLIAPEDSDSDSDSDDDGDEVASVSSRTALLRENTSEAGSRRRRHGLGYHGLYLLFGFLAICLAGYVLSQAATNIIDELGMSDVLFSVVILAIATTLPEKFIAVMSGFRGHAGILVANCAGSNIFLLSLCCGIIMVGTGGALDKGTITVTELVTLWLSTAAFTVTVWFGARYARWVGGAMLVCYIVFIVLEFTIIHST